MAATWIRASGYPLADIPVRGGLFFEYGSFFVDIFELRTDVGFKMFGFSLGVACGAKKLRILRQKWFFLCFGGLGTLKIVFR